MANLDDALPAAPPPLPRLPPPGPMEVVVAVQQQPEVFVEEEEEEEQPLPRLPPPAAKLDDIEFWILLMGFCLSSAVVIALRYNYLSRNVPTPFHLLSLAILFAFASLLVAIPVSSGSILTAKVLKLFGVCFLLVTFFVAVAIPLPAFLGYAAWTVFLISVLAISGSTFL